MKRLLSLLVVLTLAFSLAACGPKPAEKTEAPKDEPKTEAPKDEAKDEPKEVKEITAMELMKNVNARKAIASAFDKEYIQDVILNNGSKAVNYFVPAGLATDENGKDFREKYPDGWLGYDVEAAKSYWAKAKEELGFETISIEFLTYDSDGAKKLTEFIQGQLQTNLEGLTVSIVQQPFKQKIALSRDGKFQLEFAGWGPDYPDPMTFMDLWITGGGHNTAGYNNPEYDALIENAKKGELATKPAERWAALQEMEKVIIEDNPVVVPLYQRGLSRLYRPTYKGEVRHSFGPDNTYATATTEVETDGKKIIRLANTSDIPTMDVNKATDAVSFEVFGNTNEGLLTLGENDVIKPGVAESFEVSEDGLTYTFKLRDNAVWSNGDPVVAQNFVDSFRRLSDPNTGSQYMFMVETAQIQNYAAIAAGEKSPEELGVEAPDDHTFIVKIENPVPFFDKLMTFGSFLPINKKFVDEMGDKFGTSPETSLYNGPYVLTKWEVGYQYQFEKNPTYWNAEIVKNDGVNFRIIKDVASGVNLYDSGELDRVNLTAEYVNTYMDHPDFQIVPESVLFYLVFNIGNVSGTVSN